MFGGETKARDALSSLLYSSSSSFSALSGCKNSAPPSFPSSPFPPGTSSNHLLGPLGFLGKGRAASFGRKAAGCHKGGSATAKCIRVSGAVGLKELGWTSGCVGRWQCIFSGRASPDTLPCIWSHCCPHLSSSACQACSPAKMAGMQMSCL